MVVFCVESAERFFRCEILKSLGLQSSRRRARDGELFAQSRTRRENGAGFFDVAQTGSRPAKIGARLASNLGTLESATLNGQTVAVAGDHIVIDGSQWHRAIEFEAHCR
jgi:hypothetical protein